MRKGVLARYLIGVHLGPFLFALSAITGLIFVNAIAQRVDSLVGKGLPWSVIGEFLLYSLPHTIALSLPMSVLVAVLYAFSEMAASNEITAMSAGGVRPSRIMTPVVGLGIIATLVMLFFNDTVLPESNHALKNLLLDIGRKSPTLELREQVVNELKVGTGIDRYFLTADRIDHETNELDNITIFDANDPLRQRTTYAASGEMAFNDARTDLYLTLHDGFVHEVQKDRMGGFQRLYFDQQIVPLRDVGNELDRRLGGSDRSDREMGFALLGENARSREAQLDSVFQENRLKALEAVRVALNQPLEADTAWAVEARRRDLTGVRRTASYISQDGLTQQLVAGTRARAARASALEQAINRYKVEIHKKWAIAFACLVFVLMGPPLALRFPQAGVGFVVVASAVIFFVYWVGLLAGETMADRRVADPAVTMWLGNVIFLAIGITLLRRMGHSVGTARGGGMGDAIADFFGGRRDVGSEAGR
ncbi:MAG: LptF/LptG family permease [Gemmatimonadetes bacterium]|nr:LptF/LptG family permease [Gemmatimonadota bacterium]MDA1104492.1 LptF/LptG family permease [Gemmatimonadota bacterium]